LTSTGALKGEIPMGTPSTAICAPSSLEVMLRKPTRFSSFLISASTSLRRPAATSLPPWARYFQKARRAST
jgi:hypothetical protein